MIKVAALTAGREDPSSRFRVRQHINALKSHDIEVREYTPFIDKYAPLPGWPASISYKYALPYLAVWQTCKLASRLSGLRGSWNSDITWLERELLPGYLTLEPFLHLPMVIDVDDSIWIAKPFGRRSVAKTAKRAVAIIAGNRYLADWFSQYNSCIHIVPTAIDTCRYLPRDPILKEPAERFTIGWTGTAGNLKYLYAIEQPLKRFLSLHSSARLLVIADQAPQFRTLPADRVRYVRWSQEIEAAALIEMDAGIMPLSDDEWTRGKCSFKLLQYMACSLPVVFSPVGMNADVASKGEIGLAATTESDWYDALGLLYADPNRAAEMGRAGRWVVESQYSSDSISRDLARIFKGLV